MKSERADLMTSAVHAWVMAAQSLGIAVVTPCMLRFGQASADCIAFLPHFGSSHGMMIGLTWPPDFKTDAALIECVTAIGLFVSFVNVTEYAVYDTGRFKEALRDWGFFGPPRQRPAWLGPANGAAINVPQM